MEISEIKLNTRVRVPATENGCGGGYHYAYVRNICTSLFSDDPVIIVQIPALKIEKAVDPGTIIPARKVKIKKKKQ